MRRQEDAAIVEVEFREWLNEAYGKLTGNERLIATLRRAGYTWCEVGKHLRIAPTAAQMILYRAEQRIRSTFRAE